MKVSVIIVSFNTKDLLKDCLNSVIETDEEVNKEIFVVDNASTDGSVEMVKREFTQVKLIKNKENLGFAKANNQAIREAGGEYCLLLNSDTEVERGALEKLIEFAGEHPEAGVIGARLLDPDGSIQSSVYHLPTIWGAIKEYWMGQKGAYEKYTVAALSAVSVEAVTFAAALIPKITIEKIGLLDERYFMYFEDLDYCRRAQKAGLKVYYLPQAEIVHHHGASGKGSSVTYQYSVESSKIYNGQLKYWFLTFIIWLGQKWRKIFGYH